MGLTFSINGKTFGALSPANGSYALSCVVTAARYDNIRYHVKGVTGNYVTHGGYMGQLIQCRMRYVDTLAGVYAGFEADKAAWQDTAVAITEPDGANYARCLLQPGGMRIVREPAAMGRGVSGQVFMDAEAVFICDGGKEQKTT